MPKKIIEINKFTGGIVSTPSPSDIDEQQAVYSKNIDPQTSEGRLQGIDKDKVLTNHGFAPYDESGLNLEETLGPEEISNTNNSTFVATHYWKQSDVNGDAAAHHDNDFATVDSTATSGPTEGTTSLGSNFTDPFMHIISTPVAGSANENMDRYVYLKDTYFQNIVQGQTYRLYFDIQITSYTRGYLEVGVGHNYKLIAGSQEEMQNLGWATASQWHLFHWAKFNNSLENPNKIYDTVIDAQRNYVDFVALTPNYGETNHGAIYITIAGREKPEFEVYLDNFSLKQLYQTEPDSTRVNANLSEFVTLRDKTDSSRINLIGVKTTDTTNTVTSVAKIDDIFGNNVSNENIISEDISSVPNEFDLAVDNNKVYMGMGGSLAGKSKVAMDVPDNPLTEDGDKGFVVENAELVPPGVSEMMGDMSFSEFIVHPLHGTSVSGNASGTTMNGTVLSYDDQATPVGAIYADYDKSLDNSTDISETLWTALESGGVLDGLLVGQIFKATTSSGSATKGVKDFTDGAMQYWKHYDYDKSLQIIAGDLFMFCGYIYPNANEKVPVLRFIGNLPDSTQGGTPAFAYAITSERTIISKISLTTEVDSDAFGAGNIEIAKSATATDVYTIARQTTRATEYNVADNIEWVGTSISAFSICTNPLQHSLVGLADANVNPHAESLNTFYDNGGLKRLYRHGVFYIASENSTEILHRLNIIDFHELTNNGVSLDSLNLNFTKIPNQLWAEDGQGIVRRTIEDQDVANNSESRNIDYDPKHYDWQRIPLGAQIIGITETFECGKIDNISTTDYTSKWDNRVAYLFNTKNESRLTSGDHVRFAGMMHEDLSDGDDPQDKFNLRLPYEVSVVNDGSGFFVDVEEANNIIPELNTDKNPSVWWNSKVWILYGKKTPGVTFNKWDLFLYNANTVNIDTDKELYMADRTPPYHQVRYYSVSGDPNAGSDQKLYYPAEFAFIKGRNWTPGSSAAQLGPVPNHKLSNPGADILGTEGNATYVQGLYPQFGIYDKSGRWSVNGLDHELVGQTQDVTDSSWNDRRWLVPPNWIGGRSGPRPRLFTTKGVNYTYYPGEFQSDVPDGGNTGTEPNNSYKAFNPPYMGSLEGQLLWGQNLGWSTDGERSVESIKNSLHPVVPYSSLYMGSMFYTGYNSTTKDDFALSGDDPLYKNHNRPKHAVTFLGKTSGKFVEQPGLIGRFGQSIDDQDYTGEPEEYQYQIDPDETGGSDTYSYIKRGYPYHAWMSRPFTIQPDSDYLRIKEYNNDLALYTIDDFSGHRGSCQYTASTASHNVDETMANISTGILYSRPNWGGPEIENPNFIFDDQTHDINGTTYQYGTHSSVNGGFIDPENDDTSRGWDGYKPPFLFTPGSGYYVYINRTWKSMQPNNETYEENNYSGSVSSSDDADNYARYGIAAQPTVAWGFQIGVENGAFGLHRNRWHNFSNTALSDNVVQAGDSFFNPTQSWNIDNQEELRLLTSRFNLLDGVSYTSFFNHTPSDMQSICTMHKLVIPEINNNDIINNVFPIVLNSSIATNGTADADFSVGYMCGIQKLNSNLPYASALILRTNFDYIWDLHARAQNLGVNTNTQLGRITQPGLFVPVTHTALNQAGSYPLAYGRGTHSAEVMDIYSETTKYLTESITDNHGMKQAAFNEYNIGVMSSDMKIFGQTPYIPSTGATDGTRHDWFVNVASNDMAKNYFGYEADHFERNASGDTDFVEDSGGTFTNTVIFTSSSDATILTNADAFMTFTLPDAGVGEAIITEGTYFYKLAFEYDNRYESPLSTVTVPKEIGAYEYDYIQVNLKLPSSLMENINKRVTGISVYRKLNSGDEDAFSLVKTIKFTDSWTYSSSTKAYSISIQDTDNPFGTYNDLNGIDFTIKNTSLNYGLSTVFQGYLLVTKAWHPKLDDVKRYIFRSLPGNFFAFDWTKDFVIMPEIPIAMTSFNSRLYVWGANKLYKLDPYSLLIEDEYEGISILNKDAFVKTEYGLCFMDANNIYIHNGNQPTPIADPILESSGSLINYETAIVGEGYSGYAKLEQGYRDLVSNSLANGYNPNIFYSGLKNSFIINMVDKALNGIALAYNISRKRWDIWDAPRPSAVSSTKDSNILINDKTYLWNFMTDISDSYTDYKRREWDWVSKDINFGLDTQDKVFKTLSLTGTPSIFNYEGNSTSLYVGGTNNHILSVQVYVDDILKTLTIMNKFYDTVILSNTEISTAVIGDVNFTTIFVKTPTSSLNSSGGVNPQEFSGNQAFIRPGHFIKIQDEIMFVTDAVDNTSNHKLTVLRAQMGTTVDSNGYGDGALVSIVSPKFKFPAGTKGNRLNIRLFKQRGYVDSIGITYKSKNVK